ncbi:helix-turn-helix transcriptional regulator [Bradyrhizobium liaoningense]|uniref:helix-turn-helix transcriptional regulator n=1 Tax=Bradyrhizobium liaoningense TaxID=43992 RepID=UPI001BA7A48C|nr:helix-turn-helix transcriptional regulator [Bradyrhizobium liaoningense]MBR0719095.1 helix-turn-helix transcriptional regulator [Bradyrhizobium liaoningense]
MDKSILRHREYHSFGVPPVEQIAYLDHYAPLNPRLPFVFRQEAGEIACDNQILTEKEMDRSPFYAELLSSIDFRYFLSATLKNTGQESTSVVVHRSPKQGHVDRAGILRLERLVSHVKGAFDVAQRLKGVGEARHSLEHALDWLANGVVLIGAGGGMLYANVAFQAIARADDGIWSRKGAIEFRTPEARRRFDAALAAVRRPRDGDPETAGADFPAPRPSGAPAYLVSVRPLPASHRDRRLGSAAAIVFVRDPLSHNAATIHMLREVFGLTDAEASVAQALQAGVPPGDYARARAVSLNTVYTHLRKIKEKTDCSRMAELIRKLNDLQVPLRID